MVETKNKAKQEMYQIIKLDASKIYKSNFDLNIEYKKIFKSKKMLINELENPYLNKIKELSEMTDKQSFMSDLIQVDCTYKQENKYNYDKYKFLVFMLAIGRFKITDVMHCYYGIKEEATTKRFLYKHIYNINNIERKNLKKNILIKIKDEYETATIIGAKFYNNNPYMMKLSKQMDTEYNLMNLINNGFIFNGSEYVLIGMSGSMARHGIKAFVNKKYYDDLFMFSANGKKPEKCQIPKYEAYRNLLFSSAYTIKDFMPNIIVVPDYEIVINDVPVKYPTDELIDIVDKDTGELKKYNTKIMKLGTNNEVINCIDGCGMGEKTFFDKVNDFLGLEYKTNAVQFRFSEMKGLMVYVPFLKIFKDLGVKRIIDIDGNEHIIKNEIIDAIIPISVYKGSKFFKTYEEFKNNLLVYGHKLAITGWNKPSYMEQDFTRLNMQYLQVLSGMTKDKIIELAKKYSTSKIEGILNNEEEVLKFLGVDEIIDIEEEDEDLIDEDEGIKIKKNTSKYIEAIKYDKRMLHDSEVNKYIQGLIKNIIKQMKYGKIWCEGRYRYLVPDMFLFITHIANISGYKRIKPMACLKENEIFVPVHSSADNKGKVNINYLSGEYAGFRSPMLAENEINAFNAVTNRICEKYFSHMDNLMMLCSNSTNFKRMQTADADGDRAYITKEKLITESFKRNLPLIVDINEAKAPYKKYDKYSLLDYHMKTLDCLIGQCTNKCSSILNKQNIDKYIEYVELLSIIVQKETDYVKAGIRWETSYYINLISKDLPYFFIYRYAWLKDKVKEVEENKSLLNKWLTRLFKKNGWDEEKIKKEITNVFKTPEKLEKYCDAYSTKNKILSIEDFKSPVTKTRSPLNELCFFIEKWEKELDYKGLVKIKDAGNLYVSNQKYDIDKKLMRKLVGLYLKFNRKSSYINRLSHKKKKTDEDKELLKSFNWEYFYNDVKLSANSLIDDNKKLLYYAYKICYKYYPKKSKKFMWVVAEDAILDNLKLHNEERQLKAKQIELIKLLRKRMVAMEDKNVFPCTSVKLKKYFMDNGLKYFNVGINSEGMTVWQFEKTPQLKSLLQEYTASKPKKFNDKKTI
jgi:hypothetical protein